MSNIIFRRIQNGAFPLNKITNSLVTNLTTTVGKCFSYLYVHCQLTAFIEQFTFHLKDDYVQYGLI